MSGTAAVTGAFGYTGKYIARDLLARGEDVITLTGNPARKSELSGKIRAAPFRFDKPEVMAKSLAGCRVLYNTYWVRFDRDSATHERAIGNTMALLRAASMAGVERVVHVSITNPDIHSPLPYFRGKARLEEEVRRSGMSHAIVRPTVIFGKEDILINNIAYLLRKAPVFLIPGSGGYRLQPVFVEDVARIAAEAGGRVENLVIDAVGPEVFTFEELVRLIRRIVKSKTVLLHAPAGLALFAARLLGLVLGDVVLTDDELKGLTADLLVSSAPPSGRTALSEWLTANAGTAGRSYASELQRHYKANA